jgi:hypothetical protein
MRYISAATLAATLAVTASACAFESDDDEVDRDPSSLELDSEEPSIEGSLPVAETEAVSGERVPIGLASIDCAANPVINPYPAFNGQWGAAICQYGATFVPNYLNQFHEFIIGTDNRVYHDWFDRSTGAPSGWESQGGFATSGVRAGTVGSALRICVTGHFSGPWWRKDYLPGSGWTEWRNAGNGADCSFQFGPSPF